MSKLTAEQIEALKAVDVLSQPDRAPEEKEYNQRVDLLQNARINLKVPPTTFDRLLRVAGFRNLDIEDYCIQVLNQSLEQAIGTPVISGPSNVSGTPVTAKKVVGPTYAVERG